MRRFLVLTFLFALCSSATIVPTQAAGREAPDPADGRFGIKLVEAPVERREDPRAHEYIIDHLVPGEAIRRRVQIRNDSNDPQHVEVYAGGAGIHGGRFVFAPARAGNELAKWTSFDRTSLDLAPHERATVRAAITVPAEAVKGERYAVIWAQISAPAHPSRNVSVINRVGVRVYLDVGPGGEPQSDFRIEKLTSGGTREGRLQVLAQVRNTGHRALDMSGSLSLTHGPGSLSAGPFPAALGTTLAPGDTGTVAVTLDNRLPAGPWRAHLTLVSGLVKHTLTSPLTLPTGSGDTAGWGAALIPTHWPGGLLAGLLATALAALILVLVLRAGRRAKQ
ncbi:COG1470 family protein [Streptomyces sp. NPDC002402]